MITLQEIEKLLPSISKDDLQKLNAILVAKQDVAKIDVQKSDVAVEKNDDNPIPSEAEKLAQKLSLELDALKNNLEQREIEILLEGIYSKNDNKFLSDKYKKAFHNELLEGGNSIARDGKNIFLYGKDGKKLTKSINDRINDYSKVNKNEFIVSGGGDTQLNAISVVKSEFAEPTISNFNGIKSKLK